VTRIVSTRARGDDGVPPRPYATVAAFERALRAKLNARTVPGRTYQDLRKLLAFDRILARLSAVAPDEWRLKGGVALEYRLDRARSTTDIDVSAHVDFETMVEGLRAAARMNLKDYSACVLARPVHHLQRTQCIDSTSMSSSRTVDSSSR
jgi:hypothetical protein